MIIEDATSGKGSRIKILVVELHPLLSVIVKRLFPASTDKFPVPIYGAVPPIAETLTTAVPPLQSIGVISTTEAFTADGAVIITFALAEQLLASETIRE